MSAGTFAPHTTRVVHTLDGLWQFAFLGAVDDAAIAGDTVDWDAIAGDAVDWDRLPVPSAFDAYPSYAGKRGIAVYRRRVTVTPHTRGRLQFGAVGFWCRIAVDGVVVGEHAGGYSPFWLDVPASPEADREITVLVDNRFDRERSPLHEPFYDFYQYGGIHRSLWWHEVPATYLASVSVRALDFRAGDVELTIVVGGRRPDFLQLELAVDDEPATTVTVPVHDGIATVGLRVPTPTTWSPDSPSLHVVRVCLDDDDLAVRFGLREVGVDGRHITVNGTPIKLLGYCRHEAHPQFGPALPLAQIVADLQILRDLGCNFIRGSHYPQDQRFLDLCDELGFLVWEETLGWGQLEEHFTSGAYAAAHADAIREMVTASINHPSVILWGFLNEGESFRPTSRSLYADSAALLRALDPTRLVTYATNQPAVDLHLDLVDVVSVNDYPGWYDELDNADPLDLVVPGLRRTVQTVRDRGFGDKPYLLSEVGAEGLRGWTDPLNGLWTEGYQSELLRAVCEEVVANDDFAGVSLWQFHDIRTYHGPRAVKRARSFNNKGTLDEYRRPKAAYQVVRAIFRGATETRATEPGE